jgi:hypothetical protein
LRREHDTVSAPRRRGDDDIQGARPASSELSITSQ